MPGAAKAIYHLTNTPGQNVGRVRHLKSPDAIEKAIQTGEAEEWLVSEPEFDTIILKAATKHSVGKKRLGRLAYRYTPSIDSLASANALFSSVALASRSHWLGWGDLMKALNTPNRRELIVAGMVNFAAGTLTVYRGDFSPVTVPLSLFKPSGKGVAADPSDFEVIDCGHAIRLGKYEAAADAIFYAGDPVFRKQERKKRRAEDQSFGASLRRIRITRGLHQKDFSPVPEKTVARIERGEVAKPHPKTLRAIAAKLGVSVAEIGTF